MGIIFWLAVLALSLFVTARVRLSLPVASIAAAGLLLVASLLGFLSGIVGCLLVILVLVAAAVVRVAGSTVAAGHGN